MADINLLVILIIGGASFVRGAVGFGDALFAMPLLALLVPTTFSSPLLALCALLMAAVLLVREWRHLEFRTAVILIICGLLGIPLGNWLLRSGDETTIKLILGVAVFAFAMWSLIRPAGIALESDRFAPGFGFVSGILGGAYNIAGPPLVIYGTLRKWPPQQLRSVMQAYCIVGSIWIVVLHSIHGLLTASVLKHFAASVPVLVGATILGQVLTRDMSTERFARWVHLCLLLSSLTLLLSCFQDA